MTLKQFYLEKNPQDELGNEINEDITFVQLLDNLYTSDDVYEFIGVDDSIIRERLFTQLAIEIKKPYDHIYSLWLGK
jgi:hypothetical protein